jgi:hypothetical protein
MISAYPELGKRDDAYTAERSKRCDSRWRSYESTILRYSPSLRIGPSGVTSNTAERLISRGREERIFRSGRWAIVPPMKNAHMRNANKGSFSHLCFGVLGTIVVLGVAACGSVGVSNGTATGNSSGSGEGVAAGKGTATLVWTPVTQNTDGTLLMDLAGYKVFYGQSTSMMNSAQALSDPSLTTYVVTNLSSGTWYFSVAAYTSGGTLGAMSNIGTKTIN